MKTINGIDDMMQASASLRSEKLRIAFVPTMGFLHEGHLSLVREGKKRGDKVVVSIFINPMQFDEQADLQAYPVSFKRDTDRLEAEGVDILFAPQISEIYPEGFQTSVALSRLSKGLCGDSRPGHFTGVATIVAKLFNIIRPDIAIFGEKDYQQLALIRQMVHDLSFAIDIVGMPIVREADGLAMSSRNSRLKKGDRTAALSLYRALKKGADMFRSGERSVEAVIRAAKGELDSSIALDYIEIRDPLTLEILKTVNKDALFAIAAKLGDVRLIDNIILQEN
ncbi:MAG: pantoate--beta-alanine ligase [bacterium]|nr:pantoate--beta-alanine ligase [bacterium]